MVWLPNWLDERRIPIENGSGDEEIPKAGKNCRSSGKSRLNGYYEGANLEVKMARIFWSIALSLLAWISTDPSKANIFRNPDRLTAL